MEYARGSGVLFQVVRLTGSDPSGVGSPLPRDRSWLSCLQCQLFEDLFLKWDWRKKFQIPLESAHFRSLLRIPSHWPDLGMVRGDLFDVGYTQHQERSPMTGTGLACADGVRPTNSGLDSAPART